MNLLKRDLNRRITYVSQSSKIKEKYATMKSEKKLWQVFRKAATRLEMELE